jgi:hypothetical protein
MADFPERTVTAQTSMDAYDRAMRIEKLRKKYGNNLWNMSALRGRGWASSPAAKQWKSAINSSGSSLTGLSTRLKMMKDADKEFVNNQLTSNFQNWLTENPDATIGSFNTWANEQGPWYEAERRARDQKVVKDRYDAMKSTKVAEAVDTLFGEYNDEWITGSYAEQNQVRQNIADSDAIKNLPSKWRGLAVDEVVKMLNTLLSPTGRYAEAVEARNVQQEADRVIDLADARADETLKETSEVLSAKVVQEAINLMGEDSNLTRDEALDKAIAMVVPRGKTQILDEQELKRRFDLFIPEETKLQTETYYDPDSQQLVSATDAEARELGLLPKEEAEVLRPRPLDYRNAQDRFWLESGQNLVDSGEITQVLFDFYKKNGRLIYSPREQDKWIIDLWRKEKKRLEDEASAKQRSIVFDMVTGASGGQKADGIGAVRLKKKESDQ